MRFAMSITTEFLDNCTIEQLNRVYHKLGEQLFRKVNPSIDELVMVKCEMIDSTMEEAFFEGGKDSGGNAGLTASLIISMREAQRGQ